MGFVNDLYFLAHNFRKNIDIVLWGLDCVGFCWVRWNYQFWFVMLWLPMYLGWFSAYLNFNFFYYITLSIYKSRIVCVSYSLFYFLRKNWMCHIVIGGGKIGSLKAFGFMVCKSQSLHMVFWPRLPCLFNPFGYTFTSKCWWVMTPNLDQRIKYAKLLVIIWLFDIAFATVHVWIAQNALSMCLRFTLCGFIDTVYETHNLKKKM